MEFFFFFLKSENRFGHPIWGLLDQNWPQHYIVIELSIEITFREGILAIWVEELKNMLGLSSGHSAF